MNLCKVTNCPNHDKCTGYCITGAGYTAAKFIERCDTVQSPLGQIHSTLIQWKPADLLISGIIYNKTDNPALALTPKRISIVKTSKFGRLRNKSMAQAILSYFEIAGENIEIEDSENIIKKLMQINQDKLMIMPFKPGTKCKIISDKSTFGELEISAVKYSVDIETGRISGNIIVSISDGRNITNKVFGLSEYGSGFRLSKIELVLKDSKIDRKCMTVSPYGWIKPVIFENKDFGLAVDGSYIYFVNRFNTSIIGRWKQNGEVEASPQLDNLKDTVVYKALFKHISYISLHRRYIAPYIFAEETKILVATRNSKGATDKANRVNKETALTEDALIKPEIRPEVVILNQPSEPLKNEEVSLPVSEEIESTSVLDIKEKPKRRRNRSVKHR